MLSSLKLMMQDAGHGYYIKQFFNTANSFSNSYGVSSTVDTSNSAIYAIWQKVPTNGVLVTKQNSFDEHVFGKKISVTDTYFTETTNIAVDPSGNIYTATLAYDPSSHIIVMKLNSSGTLQWCKKISTTNGIYPTGLKVDSSGNIYIVGFISDNSGFMIKLNTSGSSVLQRKISTTYTNIRDIDLDSSGNIYLCHDKGIIKLNSSGGIVFQKDMSNSRPWIAISGIINDPTTGDIFLCGTGDTSTYPNTNSFVCRLSSTGALVWYNEHVYNGSYVGDARRIKKSSDEYLYVSSDFSTYQHLNKISKDGSIVYSRRISTAYPDEVVEFVKGDGQKIKIAFQSYKPNEKPNYCVASLPADMSMVGIFRGISILPYSVINTPSTITVSNSSLSLLTSASVTISDKTATVSDFTPDYTNIIKV